MADIFPPEQEQQVKKLKRLLEGWRIALLPLKSVFLWEQKWHPFAIMGCISSFYLLIWIMDLNFLTSFAMFGLIVNFLDFFVPFLCNSIINPNSWTGQKEKSFEDICRSFVSTYNSALSYARSFYTLREYSPVIYYVASIGLLIFLLWIGSTIDNTLLLFIITTALLLWPGVQNKGTLKNILALVGMPKSKPLKSE